MSNRHNLGTAHVGLCPVVPIEPGRYLLDADGRLHPERYCGFIKAVAAVQIRPRATDDPGPAKVAATAARMVSINPDPDAPRREDKPIRSTGRKPAHATREHVEPYDDETWLEFLDRLRAVKARREAGEVVMSKPRPVGFDGARLAAAYRAKRLGEERQ